MTIGTENCKRSGDVNGARRAVSVLALTAAAIIVSGPAQAYVGPSLGLGVIGAVIGVFAAVVLTIFGLVWYPMKRILGKKPAVAGEVPDLADADTESSAKGRVE